MATEHLDVLIIGAGLSGIGAACHLQQQCPNKSFAVLESREALGGTWDLFRYPGIRSDSDMYTLGYNFKPWSDPQAIADGPSIRAYIEQTAREYGIEAKIRYRHKVLKADWCSASARWTLQVARGEDAEALTLSCNHLMLCTGYYRYDAGYTPDYPGHELFRGVFIHPQHWPQGFDYRGKNIVVIGSGATAVTLVPALAEQAQHVTMLQRSPSYVVALPKRDKVANFLRRFLPEKLVYRLARTRNVAFQLLFYKLAKARPALVRKLLLGQARRQLGEDFDMRHFSPRYKPWDERLCVVPDGDLFQVLRAGKASIVTAQIERFTEHGIRLQSGEELAADAIVSATGLELLLFGGMQMAVDGQPFDAAQSMGYRGIMLRDLPNVATVMGYTNASWTLKADLSSEYFCRLINHMDALGMRQCTPRDPARQAKEAPFIDLDSGYIRRAADKLPKQGDRSPWKLYQNYAFDIMMLRYGRVDDGVMEFQGERQAA